MPNLNSDPFKSFRERVNWNRRVKAVCKPCWELKYCPYGPIVEEFPIKGERDSQSCRIFGHDCPVFYVAEPFSETKELRNISRNIPRRVQFRVLKRENQICSVCGKSVQDGDIHFDHIIPHSKGGSSDEHNIRLLCDGCNQRRSNRFEAEYLVAGAMEHVQRPIDLEFLPLLLRMLAFAHYFRNENGRFPDPAKVAKEFGDCEPTIFENRIVETFADFHEFFNGTRPAEMTSRQFEALRLRWGFGDGKIYNLNTIAQKYNEPIRDIIILEKSLLGRAGWFFEDTKHSLRKWEKY